MDFYRELKAFDDFSELTNSNCYQAIPRDWVIVISDIKGSTLAIEQGRYKDVNTLGASTIIAVQNLIGDDAFPFVFGGDGATLVISPEHVDSIQKELAGLKKLAWEQFNIQLRVGMVPLSALQGEKLEVAKYRVSKNRHLAFFKGGALGAAEELIKRDDSSFEIPDNENATVNLSGLSCRWQPIQSQNGNVLTFIVQTRQSDSVYNKIIKELYGIFEGNLESVNPVNLEGTGYRSILECIADEKRYHKSLWSFKYWYRCVEIVLAVLIFKYNFPAPFDAKKYSKSIRAHSDHRKFDEMLRMVLDCSERQAQRVQELFESLYQTGDIFYGIHRTDSALMTCFFRGPNEGEHFHFIDGSDGGYAIAAKQMKMQIKKHLPNQPTQDENTIENFPPKKRA